MKMPPYIRGLTDLFSTGKRVAALLGVIGLAIVAISAASSFVSHSNNPYYSGPLVTGNIWLYIGVILIILALLAFIGDVRYSAIEQKNQEIEGGQRLRSAEEMLENSLKTGAPTDKTHAEAAAQDKVASDDMLALAVLWQVTNARLNQYHRIATGQARRSFTTAQAAIVFGFLLLLGFAILSFRTHSTTASITIAALGAVAAALAGYISRTFIRSQETAARYLRAYFDQPLEFSRYLAAERLLSSQPETKSEERDALLRIIIEAMVENPDTNNNLESDLQKSDLLDLARNFLERQNEPNRIK